MERLYYAFLMVAQMFIWTSGTPVEEQTIERLSTPNEREVAVIGERYHKRDARGRLIEYAEMEAYNSRRIADSPAE